MVSQSELEPITTPMSGWVIGSVPVVNP